MRIMQWLVALVLLAAGTAQGAPFIYTSTTGLTYSIEADKAMVTLGDKAIVDGEWLFSSGDALFNAAAPADPVGVPTRSMAKVRANAVRITQTFKAYKAVHTWVMTGEDCVITSVISNTKGPPLSIVRLAGLNLHFAKQPKGLLPSWHWTWTQAVGPNCMHPSLWVPVGAVYAADDWGFSAYTQQHFDKPKLMHCSFERDGIIPANSTFGLNVPELLEAGQSKTFDIHLRFSKDGTWKHLLTPYKANFAGAQKYVPETRNCTYFAAADKSWVRADNPFGFGDNWGESPWRRLDKADGVVGFVNKVAVELKGVGGATCIMWILPGHNPRGAQYRPDFDVFPPEIEAGIPVLVKGFADRGLRIGLAARPGEAADRTNYTTDDTFRLHAGSKSQMDRLWSRFDHTIKLGFTVYYLDTFGMEHNDYLIMKMLRQRMGPNILTYSEYTTDLMLPLCGSYLELGPDGYMWYTQEQLDLLRWLVPDANFILKPTRGVDVATTRAKGLPLIVDDWMIDTLKAPTTQPN